jgi:hypothetical protein
MRRTVGAVALVTAVAAVSAGAVAMAGGGGAAPAAKKKPLRFEAHDLYIEYNATDGDAGLQLFADAEDWKRFKLLDTKGKPLIDIRPRGRLRRPFGLSELFLEASEPSFEGCPVQDVQERFPGAGTASAESRATAAGWPGRTGCRSWSPRRPR